MGNKYFLGCSLGNLPSKYWYDPLREYSDVRRVQACSSEVATWISPREWDKYTSSITPLTWDYSPVFMGYLLRMEILYSPVNLQCFSTWENHPVLWMNFSRDHPYNPPPSGTCWKLPNLVMTNIANYGKSMINGGWCRWENHLFLFLWAICSIAMLSNQRVKDSAGICFKCIY